MSLAFCPDFQAVLYSSETSNVMLSLLPGGGAGASSPNGWRRGHCTHRIDLDEGGGEVVQLVLRSPSRTAAAGAGPAAAEGAGDGWVPTPEHPAGAFLRLRVYSLRHGREVVGLAEFAGQGRLVDLRHSPYVSFPTIDLTPGRDAVAADLADIPRVRACPPACMPVCRCGACWRGVGLGAPPLRAPRGCMFPAGESTAASLPPSTAAPSC